MYNVHADNPMSIRRAAQAALNRTSAYQSGLINAGHWRFEFSQGVLSVYHYSTEMLRYSYRDSVVLHASIGRGSVSDIQGMNVVYRGLGLRLHMFRSSPQPRGGGGPIVSVYHIETGQVIVAGEGERYERRLSSRNRWQRVGGPWQSFAPVEPAEAIEERVPLSSLGIDDEFWIILNDLARAGNLADFAFMYRQREPETPPIDIAREYQRVRQRLGLNPRRVVRPVPPVPRRVVRRVVRR